MCVYVFEKKANAKPMRKSFVRKYATIIKNNLLVY